MTELQELKEESGFSFREIAEKAGIDVRPAWQSVNEPHRVTKDVFISVAKIIGMKRDYAEELWKNKRLEDFNRRLG